MWSKSFKCRKEWSTPKQIPKTPQKYGLRPNMSRLNTDFAHIQIVDFDPEYSWQSVDPIWV